MSGILALSARRSPHAERKERRAQEAAAGDFTWGNLLRLGFRLAFDILRVLLQGARDSVRVRPFLQLAVSSSAFRRRLFKCAILNGVILLWFVLGCVWLLCRRVLPISLALFFDWPPRDSPPLPPADPSDPAALDLDFWPDVCMLMFRTVLVSPLYIFALPFNTLWYRDMAKIAYESFILSRERSAFLHQHSAARFTFQHGPWHLFQSFTLPISQMVHRFFLTLLFTLCVTLSTFLGGSWLTWIQLSLLTSYYACEYRWDLVGRSTDARFFEFETSWVYHVGFGLPTTLLMVLFDIQSSVWGSVCICLLFPWVITNALHHAPQQMLAQSAALMPLRDITHRELRKRSGRLFWAGAKHGIRHSRRARRLWVSSAPDGHTVHTRKGAVQLTSSVLGFVALLLSYQLLSALIQFPLLSVLSSLLDTAALKWRSAFDPSLVASGAAGDGDGANCAEETYQIIDDPAPPPTPPSRLHRRNKSRTCPQKNVDRTDRELCDLVLEQRSALVHRFLR